MQTFSWSEEVTVFAWLPINYVKLFCSETQELLNVHFRGAFLVNLYAYGFFSFNWNQEVTIIGTSQGLFSVYIRTSFFYVPVSDFNQYVFFIFFFLSWKPGSGRKWKSK